MRWSQRDGNVCGIVHDREDSRYKLARLSTRDGKCGSNFVEQETGLVLKSTFRRFCPALWKEFSCQASPCDVLSLSLLVVEVELRVTKLLAHAMVSAIRKSNFYCRAQNEREYFASPVSHKLQALSLAGKENCGTTMLPWHGLVTAVYKCGTWEGR